MSWQLTELSGTCLSPGYGWGRVGVIGAAAPADRQVLVASSIEPADVPAIFDCSCLILESGDLTSHAAITARELGIPALADVTDALAVLRPGELVYVDATRERILRSRPGDDACPFCDHARQVEVLTGTWLRAVEDMFPAAESHLLVVPKRHVVDIAELTGAEWSELGAMLTDIQEMLRKLVGVSAFNAALNVGTAAGQSLEHLHWHVLPRKTGDDEDPRGGVRKLIRHPFRPYPEPA